MADDKGARADALVRVLVGGDHRELYLSDPDFAATVEAMATILPGMVDALAEKCRREGARPDAVVQRLAQHRASGPFGLRPMPRDSVNSTGVARLPGAHVKGPLAGSTPATSTMQSTSAHWPCDTERLIAQILGEIPRGTPGNLLEPGEIGWPT